MKKFCFNTPINSVSFGQVSVGLIREALDRGIEPNLFPIGNKSDLSCFGLDQHQLEKIKRLIDKSNKEHSRTDPCFKLWHLHGALESPSEKQVLLSFYETDNPTDSELNSVKNNRTLFSSRYAVEVFKSKGAEAHYLPLFFDKFTFERKERKYFSDDRVVFNLCGKFERRKYHPEILNVWSRKYGNNNKYHLQCAVYNPFFTPEENDAVIHRCLDGKRYPNIQILKPMTKNSLYNDFLNSGNIVIGMSGGEGWGLPEFHSIGLGKHAVMLNAHSYKEFANSNNSVLVEPNGKRDAYDGKFFNEGDEFNQGEFYTWDEDDFIDGCEEAIKRYEASPVNEEGLKIQEEFTVSNTLDEIIKHLESV